MTATAIPIPELPALRPTSTTVAGLEGGVVWRVSVLVVAVVVSHFAALRTTYAPVFGSVGLDPNGPLVFVPFVPLGAFAVAAMRWRGSEDEPDAVPQRAADAVIAMFLLGLAWLATRIGPAVYDTDTLTWRADLLSLAPFTAAMVVALFGGRMLRRLRPALALLTLMAPALFRPVIEVARNGSSRLTIDTVETIAARLPGVTVAGRAQGQYLVVGQGAERTVVAVTQACGGGGSVLAALVVGTVVWQLTTGRRRNKAAWVAATVALAWSANVLRLLLLLLTANWFGPDTMLENVHPWLGSVLLVGALFTATLLLGRFGLTARARSTARRPFRALAVGDTSIIALVVAGTLLIAGPAHAATVDHDLTSGASELVRPGATAAVGDLTQARVLETVPWAAEYLGRGATWGRWLRFDLAGRSAPVAIDVQASADPSRFDQYSLASCLGFHRSEIIERSLIALPGGRRAERISYVADDDSVTTVLSWRQEVPGGMERVVLHQPLAAHQSIAEGDETLRLLAVEILLAVDGSDGD
jgi:exosortase/archaeosortase family protein